MTAVPCSCPVSVFPPVLDHRPDCPRHGEGTPFAERVAEHAAGLVSVPCSPKRIQLRRTKGWRKPEGAVVVARPSRYGNPFTVAACIEAGYASDEAQARTVCVHAFADWLRGNRWADGSGPAADERRAAYLASIPELRGRDLACWCPLDGSPCHADYLLEIANAVPCSPEVEK